MLVIRILQTEIIRWELFVGGNYSLFNLASKLCERILSDRVIAGHSFFFVTL